MSAKEAYKIITNKYPDLVVIECLESKDFFAFGMAEKGMENELMGGAYDTVSKDDGTISTFNPTSNMELFMSAKEIDVNTLI